MSQDHRTAPLRIDPNDIPRAMDRARDLRSQAVWAMLAHVFRAGRRALRGWTRDTRSARCRKEAQC